MKTELIVVRVDQSNYKMFDDMVFERINGRNKTKDEQAVKDDFNEIYKTLEKENLFVYAAQIAKKFVAWISIIHIPKVGRTNGKGHMFIDELWVNPAFRKKGIAKALMEKADELSIDLNTLGIRLYVNINNEEAIRLYKNCGCTGEQRAYFMEKEM